MVDGKARGRTTRPSQARAHAGAALLIAAGLAAVATPVLAEGETARSDGMTSPAASAAFEPRSATLRLRVAYALESGRLVVKLAERVILSTPFVGLAGEDGEPHERDLSVPEGQHALTVQMLDALGRVVAKGMIHRYVGGPEAPILEVAKQPGAGAGLTLIWRTP